MKMQENTEKSNSELVLTDETFTTNKVKMAEDSRLTVTINKTKKTDESIMRRAIRAAKKAIKNGDVPVGAVVVCEGEVVAVACNTREKNNDATAHAETLAIKKACKKLGRWNLSDCELFVTLEPCAMCAGAIINSRISRVIFGAYDRRFGCGGSLINLLSGSGLNHNAKITAGVLEEECSVLLSGFFKNLRNK